MAGRSRARPMQSLQAVLLQLAAWGDTNGGPGTQAVRAVQVERAWASDMQSRHRHCTLGPRPRAAASLAA